MEDRGVPLSAPLKLTKKQPHNISQKRNRKARAGQQRRDRMREFIHELYEELHSLAVAARSVLNWPLPAADRVDRPGHKA